MRWPGEAAAAEGGGVEVEVATVFLHQYVAGDLGSTKEAVFALVDAQTLVDAELVIGMHLVDLPASLVFYQRQFVGGVAIDLIGAGKDEGCVGAETAHGLEEVERAIGIAGEIGNRLTRGPIVRGLGRGVDDECDLLSVLRKECVDGSIVADIDIAVLVLGQPCLELLAIPGCGPVCAEEVLTHIIVDPDNVEALLVEEAGRFAAYETGRASYKDDAQRITSLGEDGADQFVVFCQPGMNVEDDVPHGFLWCPTEGCICLGVIGDIVGNVHCSSLRDRTHFDGSPRGFSTELGILHQRSRTRESSSRVVDLAGPALGLIFLLLQQFEKVVGVEQIAHLFALAAESHIVET